MIKIILLLWSFVLVLLRCNTDPDSQPNVQSNGKLVLVDSSGVKAKLHLYQTNFRMGYYPIYYLGEIDDTIRLGKHLIPRHEVGAKNYNRSQDYVIPGPNHMRIFVDTAFSLSHTVNYEHFDQKQEKTVLDSIISYQAIPIFVYNRSKQNIAVGWSNSLGYVVMQAKNKKGQWSDIEQPMDYYCVTGARLLIIEPNQMIVAKLIKHEGSIRAICRLKFANFNGVVYSNTFTDNIDEQQLTEKRNP